MSSKSSTSQHITASRQRPHLISNASPAAGPTILPDDPLLDDEHKEQDTIILPNFKKLSCVPWNIGSFETRYTVFANVMVMASLKYPNIFKMVSKDEVYRVLADEHIQTIIDQACRMEQFKTIRNLGTWRSVIYIRDSQKCLHDPKLCSERLYLSPTNTKLVQRAAKMTLLRRWTSRTVI
jgi:hypothetical protein